MQTRANVRCERQRVLADHTPARNRAAHSSEARADYHLGAAVEDRLDHRVDIGRVMLTVAVEQHQRIDVHVSRLLEGGFDGGRLAQIVRMADHRRARGLGDLSCVVARAVVDDQHLTVASAQLQDEATDIAVLVISGDGNNNSSLDVLRDGAQLMDSRDSH